MSFNDDEGRREEREHNRAKRRRRHLERIGFHNAQCIFCGEDDYVCLHLDHIDGREFSDVLWPLCANCHAKRTHLQKDHPPKGAMPTEPLERSGRFVEALADYLEMSVTRLREFGPILSAEAAQRSPRARRDGDNDEPEESPN